jgi:hypothetical protein
VCGVLCAANVWDTCDTIKAPLSNKSALFKRMGGALRSINDAIREVWSKALCHFGGGVECVCSFMACVPFFDRFWAIDERAEILNT